LPTAAGFPQGLIQKGAVRHALDRRGAANYAGPALPHPEAAVRDFLPKLRCRHRGEATRHDPAALSPATSGNAGDEAAIPPGRRLAVALPLLLALAGCHLLDQTDFEPKRPAPPAPPPLPETETRAALVTIDYTKANPDYASALTAAIQTVEARRPGSLYDVVAVVGDYASAPMGRAHAADVMTTIEAAGVIPARIQLGLRLEPGRKIPQVRVYLR
jgi:hypothetical protein